ncbi:MAG TPA: FAD-binding oxidoreductase [Solirubrobacterales bacterium]|nr:FAD-binding oxidoreductase [Solirubrobacterales bacterium]
MKAAYRRFKHWGWGFEDQQPDERALEGIAGALHERLGFEIDRIEQPVPLADVKLPRTRLKPPAELKEMFTAGEHTRAAHSMGKAYRDVVRGFRGIYEHLPDLVAFPESPEDVDAVLSWCADERAAAIPFGGGTSVVGGVEPRLPDDRYRAVVTLDMRAMDRVLEVDAVSRAARIQAGATGPRLEEQLREHGLTLRHFPQSFEYSTLGGWLATRAGGHYATVYTHVDDLVESIRALTPAGGHEWISRRLPGSGAGPSPDRALLGSEGILGVITEAWMRVQERPRFKLSTGVRFDEFAAGAEAVRELSQAALFPTNCRLLDATEAETTGAGPPGRALLVLGFEAAHHPVDEWMSIALEVCREHGGEPGEVRGGAGEENPASGEDSVSAWRHAFLNAPYLRDAMVACGILSDTFETAITWDRFPGFHEDVMEAAREAVAEVTDAPSDGPGSPRISCRFTHVYPDGPAPYYTVLAPAKRGGEVEQWDEIKAAVSEIVIDGGGTITHHHAIGRDHRPWYDRQRPEPFAAALRAAKRELDPRGILNPGVLVDPDRDD